ncbi:MAG TPA: protein phosphatase 2C domain-containing protein, partial [Syntrophobacteraceae bacterium]|nr:protein phosphatase 2C domain-containing protein [Syntrophobacteraceae bacterium]
MTKLSFSGLTDVGRVRRRNEDNWAAHPDRGIFLVADGMGGAARGDLASRIVADTLPTLLPQSLEDLSEPRIKAMAQAAGEALIQLNGRVTREADSNPEL